MDTRQPSADLQRASELKSSETANSASVVSENQDYWVPITIGLVHTRIRKSEYDAIRAKCPEAFAMIEHSAQ